MLRRNLLPTGSSFHREFLHRESRGNLPFQRLPLSRGPTPARDCLKWNGLKRLCLRRRVRMPASGRPLPSRLSPLSRKLGCLVRLHLLSPAMLRSDRQSWRLPLFGVGGGYHIRRNPSLVSAFPLCYCESFT